MRIRKAAIRWSGGSVSVDFRDAEGRVFPIVPITGAHGSGKSLLLKFIRSAWMYSLAERFSLWADKDMSGEVEFETATGISSCIMREGKVVQKAAIPAFYHVGDMRDGILYFDALTRIELSSRVYRDSEDFASKLVAIVLSDFYKHKIQNSVVMVDDIDLLLNKEDCAIFMAELSKLVLRGDNQLIVTGRQESLAFGDSAAWRHLGGGGSTVVAEAMKLLG